MKTWILIQSGTTTPMGHLGTRNEWIGPEITEETKVVEMSELIRVDYERQAAAVLGDHKINQLEKDNEAYKHVNSCLMAENAELKDLQHKRWEQGWANAVKVWKPANDKLTAEVAELKADKCEEIDITNQIHKLTAQLAIATDALETMSIQNTGYWINYPHEVKADCIEALAKIKDVK